MTTDLLVQVREAQRKAAEDAVLTRLEALGLVEKPASPPSTATEFERIIWRRDLQSALRVSSETVRRYINSGRLPKPDVDLSRQSKGWKVSTLHAAGINV
jgi:hypothetical protein